HTGVEARVEVKAPTALGAVRPLRIVRINGNNRLFVLVEAIDFSSQVLHVTTSVLRFGANGSLEAIFPLPTDKVESVPSEFVAVDFQGDVYFMGTNPSESIIWQVGHYMVDTTGNPTLLNPSQGMDISQMEKSKEENGSNTLREVAKQQTKPALSPLRRGIILQTAEKYENMKWTLQQGNLSFKGRSNTRSQCVNKGGKAHQAYAHFLNPAMIGKEVSGTPYAWGQNIDVEKSKSRLNDKKNPAAAGNVCTCRNCNISGPVGVDCSGFISLVWDIGHKRSTLDLDPLLLEGSNHPKGQVASRVTWADLLPGDILNYRKGSSGHVRLFVRFVGDRVEVSEASTGEQCKGSVCRSSYSLTEMKDAYVPLRRLNIQE
ncbi:hypothetical protein NP603_08005, partial [Methylomonas sp. SURF-1]